MHSGKPILTTGYKKSAILLTTHTWNLNLVRCTLIVGGMNMERIAFGKVLQGLRKTKGITQEQLSEVLGVSAAAVSKWENEQMYPDISYFPVLARFFNVSIDCLFGFTNELSEQEYQNKLSECIECFKGKDYESGIEKIKNITYLFPTNDKLRINLTSEIIPYVAFVENQDIRWKIAQELIFICQACTEKELQVQKHFILAHLYMLTGQYKNAMLSNSILIKTKDEKDKIDISNSLMLQADVSGIVDKIDSSLRILSTQLLYELRNKASYLQKTDDLYGALALLKKQVVLVGLLELDQSFYFMLYMNIAYLCCKLGELNEARQAVLEFIKMFQENPVENELLYQVYKTGFSSDEFVVIKKTQEFRDLERILGGVL